MQAQARLFNTRVGSNSERVAYVLFGKWLAPRRVTRVQVTCAATGVWISTCPSPRSRSVTLTSDAALSSIVQTRVVSLFRNEAQVGGVCSASEET